MLGPLLFVTSHPYTSDPSSTIDYRVKSKWFSVTLGHLTPEPCPAQSSCLLYLMVLSFKVHWPVFPVPVCMSTFVHALLSPRGSFPWSTLFPSLPYSATSSLIPTIPRKPTLAALGFSHHSLGQHSLGHLSEGFTTALDPIPFYNLICLPCFSESTLNF